jgi:hypothetical protein
MGVVARFYDRWIHNSKMAATGEQSLWENALFFLYTNNLDWTQIDMILC